MWWCVVVRPRPAAACVCVVCMLACALVWLVFWVGVVGVCSGGGDTALACVCDARGVVGGVSWRVRLFWRCRGACAACGAGVVCVVARAGCSVWLGTRVCVVDRVVMSGWFVCICVDTRCAGSSGIVCGGGGSVWLCGGWGCGGAREGGRSGGGVVCVVRALRWCDASLTYVGVFAGRQVGGIGQL